MAEISSFLIQYSNADFVELSTADADLIVTEGDGDSSSNISNQLTASQIAELESQGRVVVAYVNVGVTDANRSYWQSDWTADAPNAADEDDRNGLTANAPHFLQGAPLGLFGYFVDFTDPVWQEIVLDQVRTLVGERGYGGVYLDDVSAYYARAAALAPGDTQLIRDLADAMSDFVALIRAEMLEINPDAILVASSDPYFMGNTNGGSTSAAANAYRNAVDIHVLDNMPNEAALDVASAALNGETWLILQSDGALPQEGSDGPGILSPDQLRSFAPSWIIASADYSSFQPFNHGTPSSGATVLGGDGPNVLTGGSGGDDLFGRAGDDQLTGGAGNDYLSGGADGDTYVWHPGDGSDEIRDYGGSGRDVLRIDLTGSGIPVSSILFEMSGGDLLIGIGDETITIVDEGLPSGAIEDIVIIDDDGNEVGGTQSGTDGHDLLIGSSGANTLKGEQGNDVLLGGAGDDQLYGGGVLGNGIYGAGFDLLLGGSGNDLLLGQVDDQFASGGTLMGGEGYDLYNILYLDTTISSASPTSVFHISDSDHRGEIGIHHAWLSFADFYQAGIQWEMTVNQHQIFRLDYSEGDQSLTIREYSGPNGFLLAGQIVILDFRNGDFGINLSGLNHDLIGTEQDDQLRGGIGNDVLQGLGSDDQLDGGQGADNIYGGAGNDIAYVDRVDDLVFENAGEGTDTVRTTASFYLYANIENLTLQGGAGDIYGVGNELPNTMIGNEGANLLLGGDGNDTINGGFGNDALYGEAGEDTLNGDAGIDYLFGGIGNDTLHGGIDSDALYGEDGNDTLIGGAGFFTDVLAGGAGNDKLYGNSGLNEQDYLYGEAGDDSYYVDTTWDLTFEGVGGGTDTVYADVSNVPNSGVYLWSNVENLVLNGTTAFGVGNDLANTITGSDSGNWLLGGAGNDTLNGKGGGDVLFGETGADIFVFEQGTGGDVIGDFNAAEDTINLDAYNFASFAQLQSAFIQNGAHGAINLGNGDFIVLHNVTMASLEAGDFVL